MKLCNACTLLQVRYDSTCDMKQFVQGILCLGSSVIVKSLWMINYTLASQDELDAYIYTECPSSDAASSRASAPTSSSFNAPAAGSSQAPQTGQASSASSSFLYIGLGIFGGVGVAAFTTRYIRRRQSRRPKQQTSHETNDDDDDADKLILP